MNNKKIINVLVWIIGILTIVISLTGILSNYGSGEWTFTSVFGEQIKIYGRGIYEHDSLAVVAQGIAQDYVSLILGIPLLFFSLYSYNKGTLKGKILLGGTLGFFLYTYMSYSFLWTYNKLFLVYVADMSCSLFAFILTLCSIKLDTLRNCFKETMPVKLIGGFQIFVGFAIFMLWIGKILPTLSTGNAPVGLDHYTTLVIQAMDLGIVVPVAFLSGITLIKKHNIGYMLSSIVIIKGSALLTSLSVMIISQLLAGVEIGIAEMIIFPIFNLLCIACLIILLKNVKE